MTFVLISMKACQSILNNIGEAEMDTYTKMNSRAYMHFYLHVHMHMRFFSPPSHFQNHFNILVCTDV